MILQALKEYYDRKAADPESSIAPIGWEWKEIPFIIVLDKKGSFLQFEDTREGEGLKKRGKSFLVPQGVKKSVNIAANLLWGPPDYIFGIEDRRGEEKKEKFLNRIREELPDTDRKIALTHFLETIKLSTLKKDHHWEEIVKVKPNMSFWFDDTHDLYCRLPEVKDFVNSKVTYEEKDGICIVTGQEDKISRLHDSIKGLLGTRPKGADIVSFQKKRGYDSYRKEQGYNAPVGKKAMSAYIKGLNNLLKYGSSQNIQIYENKDNKIINIFSMVFWSARKTQFESDFSSILEPPKDDPDTRTQYIKNLFDSVNTGGYLEDSGNEKFFILGLCPSGSGYRISITFFKTGTISEFAENIRQHFIDLEIKKSKDEPKYYSMWQILVNAAIQDKSENIPPNIATDFVRSIIEGYPYPMTLFQMVLRRVKHDGPPKEGKSDRWGANKSVRIALIKACLNRYLRRNNPTKKEFMMELDTEQNSVAYRLGRIFAVLERIQEKANPKINTTIRERYYGAACCTPLTVFPTLLRLKNHHIKKLESKREEVFFERLIGEIIKPPNEIIKPIYKFPPHLTLYEQGEFAIGYYHQRQDLFTSKKDNASNKAKNNLKGE